ncbi:MAG: PAS domain S-box protein, partial [Limisphaerales bacterium]
METQARAELGRFFQFTQTNAAGALVRAAERPAHWPILYVEPPAGNEAAFGYDLMAEASRGSLAQARDRGDLVLAPLLRSGQEPEHQFGYVASMPVYRGGTIPRTPAERAERLTGFVQWVLRTGDFLRGAMQDAPPISLDLLALDLTPGSGERAGHFLPAKESAGQPAATEAEMRAGWHTEMRVRFGERDFAMLFRPAPGALAALHTVNPYGALFSGLLLTAGGAFYLRTVLRRAARGESEVAARFRALFESSPDAVFVEDSQGIVRDANPAACRLHAMSRAELLGRHVTDLVPPERRAEVRKSFAKLFNRETSILEGESYTKDGRVIPVELAVRRFEYGGQVAVLLHVRDNTERRRSLAALARRERILQGVARAARSGGGGA